MNEEVDLEDGHIQVYEHWCVHVIMQDTLLPGSSLLMMPRPLMEADCTQEHSGAATHGTYMDGCSSTCLEELIHVMVEMNSLKYGLVAGPVRSRKEPDLSEHINLSSTGDCCSTVYATLWSRRNEERYERKRE